MLTLVGLCAHHHSSSFSSSFSSWDGDDKIGPEGAVALAEALKVNQTVHTIV
jgi:hypothetical protein